MPKASVSKIFKFEAAHHLPNHDGKCREPHGHSYTVVVTCHGAIRGMKGTRTGDDDPKRGMVIDFTDIKRLWKAEIEPLLDHQDLNVTLRDSGMVPETTAECLAYFICAQYRHAGYNVSEVEVWETETSRACVMAQEVWINGE